MNRIRQLYQRALGSGLAAESAWGLAVELIGLGGTVISFTLLGRSLGAEGFGGYASLYAIVGPLLTLAQAGVVLAVLQHIVRDGEPVEETARSALSITVLMGLVLTGIGAGVAYFIVHTLTWVAIIAILMTEFVTSAIVHVTAGVVQAADGFIGSAKIRLLLVGSRIVVLIALFAGGSLTVESLGIVMLASSGVLAVWCLAAVGRRFDFRFTPGRVHGRHVRTNLLYSTAISANALDNEGDKLVLAANNLVVETGLYAAAYRILSLGLIPIGSLVTVTHARFLHHEEDRRGQHLARSLRFGLIGGAYGVVFGLGLFVAAPLLPFVLGEEFRGSVEMVRWLTPVIVLRCFGMFAMNGLMGLDRVALRTTLLVVSAAIAMALYIVLVPWLGWKGAAIGTLISEVVLGILTWTALVVAQRQDDARIDARLADGVA